MKRPIVSVLIPICNVENYINECLNSVLNQTLKDIEVICIDDGSTDSSLQKLQVFADKDTRVHIIQKKNTGYGNSMNIGLEKTTGIYISIIESDDFIDPKMLETLWNLSENGTIDIVKGNFWDFYGENGKRTAIKNRERAALDSFTKKFTISENSDLLWGHPSVWSAIYRADFLKQNNIKFIEAPGGGWVDNPFFFETSLAAKSIKWTKEPLYYYRKTNPTSSSNHQPDLTLPLRRMIDNIDVVEKYHCQDEHSLKLIYARALMYLYGVLPESSYSSQKDSIRHYASLLFSRLKESVVINNFNLQDQKLYYTYLSPFDRLIKAKKKVLIYNWIQFDNPYGIGGGVNIYCRNLVETILKMRPDIDVYFLSSGWAYDASKTNCYVRGTNNIYWDRCRTFEIVNSPVPAPQALIVNEPNIAIKNTELCRVFKEFINNNGPFDAIHFNNIEGLSLDCLNIKKDYPVSQLIFSLHNYIPFCVHGFYFDRCKKINCRPNHLESDCQKCIKSNNRSDITQELYRRAKNGQSGKKTFEAKEWITSLDFEKLDYFYESNNYTNFCKECIMAINHNMDTVLAVSNRVKKIASENGFDINKLQTSYIGTKVAEYAIQNHNIGLKGEYFKLAYLGSDIHVVEKGYGFLLESLKDLEKTVASKVDLFLTTTNGNEAEMKAVLKNFHSVTIKKGYSHAELGSILHDVDLGVIPVLWEDNLPQIAIEMVAMGVPILCSSYGGASELCESELFKFQGGDKKKFLEKLTTFINNPSLLSEFWEHNMELVTLNKHWEEMEKFYKVESRPEEITVSFEDFILLQKENDFLRRNFGLGLNEAQDIQNSWSYKIGRMITYMPRKFIKILRYVRKHGIAYTFKRALYLMKYNTVHKNI